MRTKWNRRTMHTTPYSMIRGTRYIRPNLQLFSGEKTEKATPKRRKDARKKGQVFQSRDMSSVLIMLFIFVGLKVLGGSMVTEITAFMKKSLTEYPQIEDLMSINILARIFSEIILVIVKVTGPLFAIAMISGVIASYVQVGFLFTMETLKFKFDRLNPLTGFKRMFSLRSVIELIKSILKLTVVTYVAYSYLKGEAVNIINTMDMGVVDIAVYIGSTSISLAFRICMALIIIGILDFGYQWWEHEKSLKMTKQEIKEEYKQTEGNPEIKSKIKQKQRQISMRRMLHDVPKADVVITNPTHFAVAIRYNAAEASAPTVLAKGQDFIAMRIKEVAKQHNIEIVENKPLARTLYATVEIGDAIPPDLYQAVAEVLAFVYNLKKKDRVG